jgi:hypothetical protein
VIDGTRRGILKMFGVAGAAIATGVSTEMAVATAKSRGWENPFELVKPPAGTTYQWKRFFITSEDPDMENIIRVVVAGWKPVPMARHHEYQELANARPPFSSFWIEIGGLVLMEKPTEDIPEPRAHPLPWEV